jgi:hypothetical protein
VLASCAVERRILGFLQVSDFRTVIATGVDPLGRSCLKYVRKNLRNRMGTFLFELSRDWKFRPP